MTVTPLRYANAPRRRRWSANWLIAAGLVTAALAGWRWWPVLCQRGDAWVRGLMVTRCTLPADQLAIDVDRKLALRPPARWTEFVRVYAGCWSNEDAALLLSERVASNGQRRLVEVGCYSFVPMYKTDPLDLMHWSSIGFNALHVVTQFTQGGNVPKGTARTFGFELFTGTNDPQDASHFTIRYRIDQQDRLVDGYLMNDGTVRLDARARE